MFKVTKKLIIYQSPNESQDPNAPAQNLKNWLAVPAIVAGGLAGVVFLSIFLTAVVIPGGIAGYFLWRKFKKQQTGPSTGEALDAEYTVIKDPTKK